MFGFSSLFFSLLCTYLLLGSKFLGSYAKIPPQKRSYVHNSRTLPVLTKRLAEYESQAKSSSSEMEVLDVEPSLPQEMTVFRLPAYIKPQSYALKMVVDLDDNFEFFGEVKINVSVSKNSNTVFLNSHKLEIKEVAIYQRTDKITSSFQLDPVNQLLRIQTNSSLLKDEVYNINVKFNGVLNKAFKGFYRSLHSVENITKWIATTQFEATHARRAFPCFDEPRFRATFDIIIARHHNQVALSNMPLKFTSDSDPSINNRVWNNFEKTPPMPTYLVAFVIGEDLAHLTDPSGKFKLWARKDIVNDGLFAHSMVPRAVKYIENYTGIEFMLPKLDIVSVQDFFRGAMENWGLMTFKQVLHICKFMTITNQIGGNPNYVNGQTEIIYKEGDDYSHMQHNALIIVVHEIVHQWFGNYVTMEWWDSLWMKEGFATLLSFTIGALVEPDWRMEDVFVQEIQMKALEGDGIHYFMPMTNPVRTPAEIEKQFNPASYGKAASVLRMLSHVVSQSTFKKAINTFLRSGFKNGGVVTSEDLWAAFDWQLSLENRTLGNGFTVARTMKTWSDQPGYPIIKVSRYNNGNREDIGFKQETFKPFFAEVNMTSQEWIIPLTCTKRSNPDFKNTLPKLWLLNGKEMFLRNEVEKDEWILCNIQQAGYYRIRYDEENWKLISEILLSSPDEIHPLNRHHVIGDVFSLIKTDMIPLRTAFKIIRYLDKENDPIPWKTAVSAIHSLIVHFEGTIASDKLKNFLINRLNTIYKKIGFYEQPNDDHNIKLLRFQMLPLLCELGNRDCITKAMEKFNKHASIDSIPTSLQHTAMCAALKVNASSDLTWKKLQYYYEKQKHPMKNMNLILAFHCLSDEAVLKKNLKDHIEDKPHSPLRLYSLGFPLWHYSGALLSLKFVKEILPVMNEYKESKSIVTTLLNTVPLKSTEQIYLIDEMLEITTKFDSELYRSITENLNKVKRRGKEKVKFYEDLSLRVLLALHSVFDTDEPPEASVALAQISAAGDPSPRISYCLLFTFMYFILTWY